MASDIELMQAQRQIRELVVAMGRQEARAGELSAEIAIVRQEAANLRSNVAYLEEANGRLQERLAKVEVDLAALKAEIQKERKYRQKGGIAK